MKKLFSLVAVVMMACVTVDAQVLFQETFSTRRGSTYIVKAKTSFGDAWPYASQWFTGYEAVDPADNVVGNQYDYDYTDVASYTVSIRGKKLNGEDKSTVGLFFGANKASADNYVTFSTPAEFANQVLPEGSVLKFRICSSESDGGDLSTMIIVFNQDTLQVPATNLGDKAVTSDVVVALPQAACQTLTFAFDNVPAQKFISNFSIELGAEEGVENVVLTEKAKKVMVDGVMYIVRDNKMFDVRGTQVR